MGGGGCRLLREDGGCAQRGAGRVKKNWGSNALPKEARLPETWRGLSSWRQRWTQRSPSSSPALPELRGLEFQLSPLSRGTLPRSLHPASEWRGHQHPVAMATTPAPSLPVALRWAELQPGSQSHHHHAVCLPLRAGPFLSRCLITSSLSLSFPWDSFSVFQALSQAPVPVPTSSGMDPPGSSWASLYISPSVGL